MVQLVSALLYRKMLEQMGYTFNEQGVEPFPFDFENNPRDPKQYADAFAFESAVKVGSYNWTTLGDYKDGDLHQMNNADYRLQMETPAHHVDFMGLLATQVRKHAIKEKK